MVSRHLARHCSKASTLLSAHVPRRCFSSPAKPRTAVVTGGARGIGKAIALRLARDGYDIAVNDLPSAQKSIDETVAGIRDLGRRAYGHAADVTSPDEVAGLIRASVDNLGPLDTMVANAGIAQVKPLLDLTPEDFQRMFEVNVAGVHYSYRSSSPHSKETDARPRADQI